jgi:hypothetical protein
MASLRSVELVLRSFDSSILRFAGHRCVTNRLCMLVLSNEARKIQHSPSILFDLHTHRMHIRDNVLDSDILCARTISEERTVALVTTMPLCYGLFVAFVYVR